MEARQLQSAAQLEQLSQEMQHLQEALSTASQHAQAAQQQPVAWANTQDGAAEHPMAALSFSHTERLTSHPVSVTPDVSPARPLPLNMAGYDGGSITDAETPASIGAYDSRTDYGDVVSGSLTVPVLLPGSPNGHG